MYAQLKLRGTSRARSTSAAGVFVRHVSEIGTENAAGELNPLLRIVADIQNCPQAADARARAARSCFPNAIFCPTDRESGQITT